MSSGVILAILTAAVTVIVTVYTLLRLRQSSMQTASRTGPGPAIDLQRTNAPPSSSRQPAGTGRQPGSGAAPPKAPRPGRHEADDSGTRPTLVPLRPMPEPPPKRATKAYVAALEDEDDVPTTLYRQDDDPDVEALLAEFDDERHR